MASSDHDSLLAFEKTGGNGNNENENGDNNNNNNNFDHNHFSNYSNHDNNEESNTQQIFIINNQDILREINNRVNNNNNNNNHNNRMSPIFGSSNDNFPSPLPTQNAISNPAATSPSSSNDPGKDITSSPRTASTESPSEGDHFQEISNPVPVPGSVAAPVSNADALNLTGIASSASSTSSFSEQPGMNQLLSGGAALSPNLRARSVLERGGGIPMYSIQNGAMNPNSRQQLVAAASLWLPNFHPSNQRFEFASPAPAQTLPPHLSHNPISQNNIPSAAPAPAPAALQLPISNSNNLPYNNSNNNSSNNSNNNSNGNSSDSIYSHLNLVESEMTALKERLKLSIPTESFVRHYFMQPNQIELFKVDELKDIIRYLKERRKATFPLSGRKSELMQRIISAIFKNPNSNDLPDALSSHRSSSGSFISQTSQPIILDFGLASRPRQPDEMKSLGLLKEGKHLKCQDPFYQIIIHADFFFLRSVVRSLALRNHVCLLQFNLFNRGIEINKDTAAKNSPSPIASKFRRSISLRSNPENSIFTSKFIPMT